MGGTVDLVLSTAAAALLLVAIVSDWRTRTIPHWITGGLVLVAVIGWIANERPLWPDVALQIGVATLVFALFTIAWLIGQMGGGDVKLLGALALLLPVGLLLPMIVVMSLAGGALTLAVMARHRIKRAVGRPEVPYGIAIAAAGYWAMANQILTTATR